LSLAVIRVPSYPARRFALLALALLPLAGLAYGFARDELGANPVEKVTHVTGDWALRWLLAALAVTPLRRALGWRWLAPHRRSLGLLSFFYALLHLSTYVVLDQGLAFSDMLEDVSKRPYITAGLAAFLCLLPLAITSTRGWMRRLGRHWGTLHRLAYGAALAAVVHFLWLVKADLTEPAAYACVLAILLAARLWNRAAAGAIRSVRV
jgi:sulfoxide reductase heme-binding subunit YedZ